MVWVKLDDGILDHPKMAQVGPIGFALFSASLVYANRNLTDGFVPYGVARRLLATEWTDPTSAGSEYPDPSDQPPRGPRIWSLSMGCGVVLKSGAEAIEYAIAALCVVGLWDELDHGYVIHDFLDWNPSRENVLAEREKNAERVRRYREGRKGKSNDASNAVTHGDTNAVSSPLPVPAPVPVPEPVPEPLSESTSKTAAPNSGAVSSDWQYLLDQLLRKDWTGLTHGGLKKLEATHGHAIVDSALREAHGYSEAPPLRAYPYLKSICVRMQAERGAA